MIEAQPALAIRSRTSRPWTSMLTMLTTLLRDSLSSGLRTMSHSLLRRFTCFFFAWRIADFCPSEMACSALVHSTVHASWPEVRDIWPGQSLIHFSRLVFFMSA